jgi:hypothetical protein
MQAMRTSRHARRLAWVVAGTLVLGALTPALGQSVATPEPGAVPSLAVVQVVNQSGASIQNLGSRAVAALNERFAASRRWRVIGQDTVDKALAAVGARLPLKTDARDGVLLRLAEAVSADYLVLATITAVQADPAQKLALVRSSVRVFGRQAEAVVTETETTALNLERANAEAVLIDDALEQNALQVARSVYSQLNVRGKVLAPRREELYCVDLAQPDYMQPGALLAVLHNGLKIATLKVVGLNAASAWCEVVERARPEAVPLVNDEVIVLRVATAVPGTGQTAYDPGTGQPVPARKRSSMTAAIVGTLVGIAGAVAGYFLFGDAKDKRIDARTPSLLSPVNGAVARIDSAARLLQPISFVTTTTAGTDQYVLQVSRNAAFTDLAYTYAGKGTSVGSTGTSTTGGGTGTTGTRPADPLTYLTFTPDLSTPFLAAGTYLWRVAAVSGQVAYHSPVFTLTVLDVSGSGGTAILPEAPAFLTALPGNARVDLLWSPVTTAQSYRVYRRVLTPRSTATDPGRSVAARTGSSAWLRGASERRLARSTRLMPTNLGTRAAGDAVLAGFTEVGTTTKATLSYADSSVQNGIEYQYVVLSENTNGVTRLADYKALVTVVPLNSAGPAVPAGLSATPGDGQVTLAWTAGTEADLDGYQVFRSTAASGNFIDTQDITKNLVRDANSPATEPTLSATAGRVTLVDRGLTNGVTVFYRVRAVQRKGQYTRVTAGGGTQVVEYGGLSSALSDAVQATPSGSPPQELQVTQPPFNAAIDVDRPQLAWRGMTGATEYWLEFTATAPTEADAAYPGDNVIRTKASATEILYPAALPALQTGTWYMHVGVYDTALQRVRWGRTSQFVRQPIARYATSLLTTISGQAFSGAQITIDGVSQGLLTPAEVILARKVGDAAYAIQVVFNDINGTRYEGSVNYRPGLDDPVQRIPLGPVGVAPPVPTGVTVTGEADRVVLRWNVDPTLGSPSAAARYSVQRRANTLEGEYTEIAIVTGPTGLEPGGATQLTYADFNVGRGIRYYYRLVALSAAGVRSVPSVPADGVAGVGSIQAIAPQTNQRFDSRIYNSAKAWENKIDLVWLAVANAKRYVVEVGHDAALHNLVENGNEVIAASDQPAYTVTFAGSAPEKTAFYSVPDWAEVYWRVIAVDDQNRIINQSEARRFFIDTPHLMAVTAK